MQAGSFLLVVLTVFVIVACFRPAPTHASPAPLENQSRQTFQAIPWIDDLLRSVNPEWIFKALGKVIEWRTGKSAAESQTLAKRVSCLVANGSTSPEQIYSALNYAAPYSPISLQEAQQVSGSIAEFKESNPTLFWLAKRILKQICQ